MKIFLSIALLIFSVAANAGQANVDQLLADFTYSHPEQKNIENAPVNTELTMFMAQADYRLLQEKHKLYLLLGIIVFTPIFLWLVLTYIRKCDSLNSEGVVHASGLVLIVQSTTFIVIAAPTSEQLTAAIGVLAAIAGYLFGSSSKRKNEKESTEA